MSKRRTKDVYWYHAYNGHNAPHWWFEDWMYDECKRPLNGGFTLCINPETQVVSIAICSGKDRFSRKQGRDAAYLRYISAVDRVHYDGKVWYILTPSLTDGSDFATLLRTEAYKKAIETIVLEHGGKDFTTLVVETPKPGRR